jgi:hypothetical protein
VNEARISYQRNQSQLGTQGTFTATEVGMTPNATGFPVLPFFSINGLFEFGTDGFDAYYQGVNQTQVGDQISWTRGKHTIRAGAEYEKLAADNEVFGLAVGQPYTLSFPDFLIGRAAGPVISGGNGTTGLSNIAGPDQNHTTNVVADGGLWPHYWRSTDISTFIQDDFKISPRLTVNLGVRWEYDGFPSEINGSFSSINPGLIQAAGFPGPTVGTGSLVGFVVPHNYIGFQPAGVTRSLNNGGELNNAPLDTFAPRVGVAWQPLPTNSRLVLRAGAGYFYDRSSFSSQQVLYNAQPYEISPSPAPTTSLAAPFFVPANVAAPPGIGFTPRFVNFTANGNPNTTAVSIPNSNISNPSVPPHWFVPTQYGWNVDAQYEFIKDWVLQVGYVGSRGIHEPYTTNYTSVDLYNAAQVASPANPLHCGYDGNPADCITTTTLANVPARVPNLGIASGADLQGTFGDYKFNSLQATVRKNMSHGLQLSASYTYSRSFTTIVAGVPSLSDTSTVCCLLNPKAVYGLNPTYRPNRFIANYHYELPFGHHEGITGWVVNGWSVSGVTTIQGGSPLNITDSRGGVAYGISGSTNSLAQYAAGMGPGNIATSGSLDSKVIKGLLGTSSGYLNSAAFTGVPNVPGTTVTGFGDGGLATILGPPQDSWDFTLAKLTKVGGIREDGTLEFRTEFFNAFNHPQFGLPTTNTGSAAFGHITTTIVNPRLIQFALKYAF